MTALPGRRRRSTILAAAAAVVATVLAIVLTTVGAITIFNSTDGADASEPTDELRFPRTPVGALAVVDEGGKLASVAVLVVQPAGAGGSVVPVPVSVDASAGAGDDRLPVAETFALEGPDALQRELEVALRLSFDTVEVFDEAQLAQLLLPVGDLAIDLPSDVTNVNGDVVAEAGASTITPAQAASILAARNPDMPAARQYPAATAVWTAVAAAVGDGLGAPAGAAASTAPTEATAAPTTVPTVAAAPVAGIADLFARLTAGQIGARPLRLNRVDAANNPRHVDVSTLDAAELSLVFGQIAPAAVAAPSAGLTFRVVSTFSDEQLAGTGYTNAAAAYAAINKLVYVGANVVSVSTDGDAPGAATTIRISDRTMESGTANADVLFGPLQVSLDERPIVGVDAVLVLGTDYLTFLASDPPAPTTTADVTATTAEATDTTADTPDATDTTASTATTEPDDD